MPNCGDLQEPVARNPIATTITTNQFTGVECAGRSASIALGIVNGWGCKWGSERSSWRSYW